MINEVIQFMQKNKYVELILGGYAANSSSMEKLDYLKERILDKLNITEADVQVAEMAEMNFKMKKVRKFCVMLNSLNELIFIRLILKIRLLVSGILFV